jgi:hypothetical protein
MGLTNYASRVPREMVPEEESNVLTEDDIKAFRAVKIKLCEYHPGAFRGKMYEELVRNATGISLYKDWIPPKLIQQMCYDLERERKWAKKNSHKRATKEIKHLLRFFRVCVERDLGLVSNY